jgi:hypothetical protein
MKDATIIALAIPSSILLASGIVAGAQWLARKAFEGNPMRIDRAPCHTTDRDPYTKQADYVFRTSREG